MATKAFLRALRKKHHLGEFRKKHTARVRHSAKRIKHRVRGVSHMVRHRRVSHRSGMFGGNKLMTGLVPMPAMLSSAVKGIGAAAVASQLLGGEKVAFQSEAVAALTGGIPAAVAVFALKNMAGAITTGNKVSVYY